MRKWLVVCVLVLMVLVSAVGISNMTAAASTGLPVPTGTPWLAPSTGLPVPTGTPWKR